MIKIDIPGFKMRSIFLLCTGLSEAFPVNSKPN